MTIRSWLNLAVPLALICLPSDLHAQNVFRIEVKPIETVTLKTQQVLTGNPDGKPTVIAGELRIPKPGTDKLPAVILVHGSGGVSAATDRWAQEINSLGVAAFILDSFSGRGISNTVNDQSQLDSLAMLVDAYRALGILAQHPRLTICYWPARSPSGLPPISIPKGLGRFGSVAQEPMVRRLPAGGRRIRTVGPSRESIGPLLPTGIPWRSNRKSCDRSIPDERARNPFASPVRPSASEIAA